MSNRPALSRLEPLLGSLRKNYPGPCLIFDLMALRDAARTLAQIGLQFGVRFIAAAKALPMPALLDTASHLGGGFDASNIGELRRLRDWCRTDGSQTRIAYVSMSGPALTSGLGPPDRFVDCLTINVETPAQLSQIDRLGGWATDVDIGARIRVDLPATADHGPSAMSRFGLGEKDVSELDAIASHPRFAALHCHIEGDTRQPGSYVASASRLIQLAKRLPAMPRRINLGGGFRRETVGDIEHICRDVRAVVPADIDIILEPGAWLTTRAGYALSKVLWTRDRPDLDATLAAVDLSRECHLRWDPPQLLRWWGAPPPREKVMLFGPTCYEADHLGTFQYSAPRAPAVPGVTSWLLFGGISGYAAAFNIAFNGVDKATVLTVGNAGSI